MLKIGTVVGNCRILTCEGPPANRAKATMVCLKCGHHQTKMECNVKKDRKAGRKSICKSCNALARADIQKMKNRAGELPLVVIDWKSLASGGNFQGRTQWNGIGE